MYIQKQRNSWLQGRENQLAMSIRWGRVNVGASYIANISISSPLYHPESARYITNKSMIF
jgi:hypothetical protein